MKKRTVLTALVAAALLAFAPAILAGGQEKAEETWTGWITDESCGAKNANAEGKGCTLSCYKNGAALVLYVKADDKLYHLDKQDLAAENVGHQVQVTGVLEEGKIKVAEIKKKES
jgi:hypothetical protein